MLSLAVTVGIVAGVDGIATSQYVAADQLAFAAGTGTDQVAVQQVVVTGHRANA